MNSRDWDRSDWGRGLPRRIEAQLLLGQYSNSFRTYARVTAVVTPVHPDAQSIILAGYAARLETAPNDIASAHGRELCSLGVLRLPGSHHCLDHLLDVEPTIHYGLPVSRLEPAAQRPRGERRRCRSRLRSRSRPKVPTCDTSWPTPTPTACSIRSVLSPKPRSRSKPGSTRPAFTRFSAAPIPRFETWRPQRPTSTDTSGSSPRSCCRQPHFPRASVDLDLPPGQTYDLPLVVSAGEKVSIVTSSHDYWDTILILLGLDGSPAYGQR